MTLDFTTKIHDEYEFLAPGRYSVSYDAAFDLLVGNPRFRESQTRAAIWTSFETYLGRFFFLEEHFAAELEGERLIHRLWLGGSYVSSKVDPSNIDVAVLVNDVGAQRIKGKPRSAWMNDAFTRRKILPEYKVSSVRVSYRPVRSVLPPERLPAEDQQYLRDRGAWDDFWQRCRPPGEKDAPTLESAKPMRGYLEVAP